MIAGCRVKDDDGSLANALLMYCIVEAGLLL